MAVPNYEEVMAEIAPRKGRFALLPELSTSQELALLCRMLHREGYDDHISGHISMLQDDETLLVNPWELTWDEVTAADVMRIDLDGKVLDGEWNVTPAIELHLALHRARPGTRVVVHNHPEWGSVWAAAKQVPGIYDQTSAQVDSDPLLVDEYQGSVDQQENAGAVVSALDDQKWAILANHGVFVLGKNVRQAHLRAITLEWRCRLAWRVAAVGGGKPLEPGIAKGMGERTDGFGVPFLWEAMARREVRLDESVLHGR